MAYHTPYKWVAFIPKCSIVHLTSVLNDIRSAFQSSLFNWIRKQFCATLLIRIYNQLIDQFEWVRFGIYRQVHKSQYYETVIGSRPKSTDKAVMQ